MGIVAREWVGERAALCGRLAPRGHPVASRVGREWVDRLAASYSDYDGMTAAMAQVAESLRLDLCHGCALEAAGISDDGSSVAANYLQRRRVAFNTSYPGIQDYHLLPWHPGLNELGLTTCSACGPNGKLSTNQRLKQRTEPVPQA